MVTLEEVKKLAEDYMLKERDMLYNMTFLSKEDLAKLKKWLTTHPHYLHLQGLGVIINEPRKDTSS